MNVKQMYVTIAGLAKSEANLKQKLGELSRAILVHHKEGGHDVGVSNRLLSVLTPANKKAVTGFLRAHLPYDFDTELHQFGGLIKKQQRREDTYAKLNDVLADPEFNLWSWLGRERTAPVKKTHAEKIEAAVSGALQDKGAPLDKAAILESVFKAGITVDDLIAFLGTMDGINLKVIGEEDEPQAKAD